MNFNVNDSFLYIVSAIVIIFVLFQSFFFLAKALKQAKKLNISSNVTKKTILSSILFTIAPAISILVGVITLSKFLGLPFPWLRLSIIGAVTYELPAATIAANTMGASISQPITDSTVFATIAWVMSLGIIAGTLLIFLGLPKIQQGVLAFKGKDKRYGELVMDSLFLGMISAFVGLLFANIRDGISGFIPIVVALVSALLMAICGLLIKKCKITWLEQYALPLSMLGAMALSLPITMLMS